MTFKQYIANLEKKLSNIKTFSDPLRVAAFDVTAIMGQRIFDEGRKTDGSEIGSQYSEKPMYINPQVLKEMSVKATGLGVPRGKSGKTKFKNGQPHKTKYLAGGYEELREKVGRQTNFVDARLSGELRLDFSNGKTVAEPRKENELEYQIRLDKEINQKKRLGIDEKYGTTFKTSDDENKLFFDTINREFRKQLSAK